MDPMNEWQSPPPSVMGETAAVASSPASAATAADVTTGGSAYVKRRRRLANGKIVQRTRNSKKCLGQPRRNPLRSVAAARKESLANNPANKRMTRKRLLNNGTAASSTAAPVKRRKRRRRSDATTAVSRDSCSENDVDDDDEDERRSTDVNNAKSYCESNNEQQHNSSSSGAIQGLLESSTSTSSIGTRSSFNIGATLDAPTGEDEVEWKEWPTHGMHERPVYHPQFGLATEHNGRYFVNRPDDKGYDEVKIDDVAKPVPKFVSSSSVSAAASRRQVATAASAKSSVAATVATVTATIATTSRRQRAADGTVTTRPAQAIAYVAPSQHQQQQQQQTPQLLQLQQQQKKQPIVLSSLDRSKVMAYLAHRAQQFGEAQHQLLQSYNLSQQRKLELLQQRLNSRPRLLQVQLSKNKNVAAVLQAATATNTTAKQQQQQPTTAATVAAAATGANTATGKAIPAAGRIITQDMLRSWREANQQKIQQQKQHQTPGKILLMPSRPLQQQQQQQQQTSTNSNAAIGAPLTMPFCGVPALNGNGKDYTTLFTLFFANCIVKFTTIFAGKVFFVRAPDLAKKLKSSEKPFTVTSTSSSPSSSSTPTPMSHQHHHHHHHHQQQQQHPHNHHNHHHQHHPMATSATTTTTKRVAMPWVPDMNLLVRNNPVAAVPKQQQQTFRTISPSEATILMPKSCHNTNGAVSNNFAYSQPYYVLDLSKKESTTTTTTTTTHSSGNSNDNSSTSVRFFLRSRL
ncbi:unnamed protein product [Trichogramma brassicae]|uniref:Uncharacterized protein n=1 Tax=Trichogramma brassicae TaxID=86971 RepID=A0A6H5IYB2_9HYME|nr:unnamed protein product [Trichogramma brassicae]